MGSDLSPRKIETEGRGPIQSTQVKQQAAIKQSCRPCIYGSRGQVRHSYRSRGQVRYSYTISALVVSSGGRGQGPGSGPVFVHYLSLGRLDLQQVALY